MNLCMEDLLENLLDAAVSGSVLLVLQQNKSWQPLKPNLIKKKYHYCN